MRKPENRKGLPWEEVRQAFESRLGGGRRSAANPAKQPGRRSGCFDEERRWEEDALLL
jgi:hypothetical protein